MAAATEVGRVHAPAWVFVILIIGLILMIVGFLFSALAPKRDHLTSVAEGVVSRVEVDESTSRKGRSRRTYLTYVEFEDSDHRVFEARSVVNGGTKRHSVGDRVTIHFDPRDPEAGCLIEGDEDMLAVFNILEGVCQIGGPAALIVGAVALLVCRRKTATA